MTNGNGKTAGATIGEAIGLASRGQLEETEKKLAFSESECIRLCGVLDGMQEKLDAQIAKTAEAESKIKAAEEQTAAATRKCAEETAKSHESQTDAERETVKAKGEEARLKRELTSATAKNKELFDAKMEADKKRQDAQREASAARKDLEAADKAAMDYAKTIARHDSELAAEKKKNADMQNRLNDLQAVVDLQKSSAVTP
jgi:chromosome segregation ATPase